MATTPGTYLNKMAVEDGCIREVSKGKFEIVNDTRLLTLRFNSRTAIVTAAEYDKKTLTSAERLGIVPKNLSENDTAKYLYYAHHEGAGGILTHLVDSKNATEEQAKAILKIRLGGAERAQMKAKQFGSYRAAYKDFAERAAVSSFPQQFGTDKSLMYKYVKQYGDYEHGYRAWLNDYTDKKVRPQNFRQTGATTNTSPTEQKTKIQQNQPTSTASENNSIKRTGMPDTSNLAESQKFDCRILTIINWHRELLI